MSIPVEFTKYKGNCHCKSIEFEVIAPKDLIVWQCNCSVCYMKQNHHFIVPKKNFKLIKGQEYLTMYQFNTKQAQHYFCKNCGVQSYYQPRSNPDGIAVTYYCISNTSNASSVKFQQFDGQNWERFYQQSNISSLSKEDIEAKL